MISYNSGSVCLLHKLFIMHGSVFPWACWIALPCALIAAAVRYFIEEEYLKLFEKEDSIVKESQAFSGFTFLCGFLIVFRTSQAYSRFWDGCTYTHNMRAEWFDACSALVAFCNYSKAKVSPALQMKFKGTLIRLFSMLHALALAELEEVNNEVENLEVAAFKYQVLDPNGLDKDSLRTVKASGSRVELIFSWIQCLVVENIDTGVLSIPPPILSRAFQEIANGMVAFHDAMKITYIPFPFPYAQTCDAVLVMHWIVAPFVMSQWVTTPAWAFIFVFIQVFIFWCLNLIAIEIENPFGTDPNDLDGHNMQDEMNRHLLLLLKSETISTPQLQEWASTPDDVHFISATLNSLWEELGPEDTAVSDKHTQVHRITRREHSSSSKKSGIMGVLSHAKSHRYTTNGGKISSATMEPDASATSGSRGIESYDVRKSVPESDLSDDKGYRLSHGHSDSGKDKEDGYSSKDAHSPSPPLSARIGRPTMPSLRKPADELDAYPTDGTRRQLQLPKEAQDAMPGIDGDPPLEVLQEAVDFRGQWEPVPPDHAPAPAVVEVERRPGETHITWLS